MNNIIYLIIHHEGTGRIIPDNEKRFKIVDDYHKSLGWGSCGYHYFIERDGKVEQGRQDNEEGAHTIGYNQKSLGICLAGDMDMQMPSVAQIISLKQLLEAKMALYSVLKENIVPHRKFANKTCYGAKLTESWARNLVSIPTPVIPPQPTQYKFKLLLEELEALITKFR